MIIKILAMGDIMLGEQSLCHSFGVTSVIERKGADFLFKDVDHVLSGRDIVFGNLEAPVSEASSKTGRYAEYFRVNPKFVGSLRKTN
jgi:hypothetical protein